MLLAKHSFKLITNNAALAKYKPIYLDIICHSNANFRKFSPQNAQHETSNFLIP